MARGSPEPNVTLYNLRDLKAVTQAEVADALHALAVRRGRRIAVTANDVSRWERGRSYPSALYRQLLAEFYGVSVADLGLTRQRIAPGSSSGADRGSGPLLELLDLGDVAEQDARVIESQRQWLAVRRAMNGRQPILGRLAAQLYPAGIRVADTGLLARPEWIPAEPFDLSGVTITVDPAPCRPTVDGTGEMASAVLPNWTADRNFPRYSYAMRDIARPTLFENRPSWRLTGAGFGADHATLSFGDMTYFDAIDVCEAIAHETAATHLLGDARLAPPNWRALRLRRAMGDPLDVSRRACIMSINTLTIRRDDHSAGIVLHNRNAASVATSGGIIGVMPAGVFQPSTVRSTDHSADFDLWRNIMREYSEEFLGNAEHSGDDAAADYSAEPFATLEAARAEGRLRVFVLGLAVGALDLWSALETVAVFDADVYDEVFAGSVTVNSEGSVVTSGRRTRSTLVPLTQGTIEELLSSSRLAAETRFSLSATARHLGRILD